MPFGKKLSIGILLLLVIVGTINTADARSVYVISDTGTNEYDISVIRAYEIDGNSLVYQTEYQTHHPLAISLVIDAENGFLFVTHEKYSILGNKIEIVDAKAMQYVDTVTATGASNLAGIAYDQTKKKVYVVDRGDKYLYVYNWYPNIPQLVLHEQVQLPGLIDASGDIYGRGGAWGIALDEENNRLWVTSNETKVRFYDTNDWSHDPNTDFITVSQQAVGVALDLTNQYVYMGTAQVGPNNVDYFSQYDLLADPNTAETTVNIGTEVVGIAVDQQTGLVYLTTYGDSGDSNNPPPKDRLMIYDSNLTKQQWESGDIGNPAGVAVAGDVSYKPPLLKLNKVDDWGLVKHPSPGDYINYTISYDANGHSVNDVNIVDYLPDEVDFNSASGPNMVYDSDSNTVTWQIGNLGPNDSNSVTLKVRIKDANEPLGIIANYCEMESDLTYNSACCFTPDVIYVDNDANGCNNGASWQNAYTDLQDALNKSRSLIRFPYNTAIIWVAAGTYYSHTDPSARNIAFELVDGVAIYGGFTGTETSLNQRNWITNETILEGDVPGGGDSDTEYLVKAIKVGETAIIDGFTIRNGYKAGVYCEQGSPTIRHCKSTENLYGIYCKNQSSVNIIDCEILDNIYQGVYCQSQSAANITNTNISNNGTPNYDGIYCADKSLANITNCNIRNNGRYGIFCSKSSLTVSNCIIEDNSSYGIYASYGSDTSLAKSSITNNIIRGNGSSGIICYNAKSEVEIKNNWIYKHRTDSYGYGISINGAVPAVIIRNNTIVKNADYGIYSYYNDDVNITSCIVLDNDDGQLGNCSAAYSWTSGNPYFFNPDANNYHLSPNSPCIDTGNPNFTDYNETDIDGEPRIIDGDSNNTEIVDMGADEFYWSPADFDQNEIVNFLDYALFANGWQTEDANYSLDGNNDVDNNDLDLFCEDWLWQPAWTDAEPLKMMGCGIDGGLDFKAIYQAVPAEQQTIEAEQIEAEEPDIETLKELVAFEEMVLEDEEVREMVGEDNWQEFSEGCKRIIDSINAQIAQVED
jgi:hypothetical protein